MAIIELKDVSYSYDGKRKVLDKVNGAFEKGKVYAIVGKSGIGKSTLLTLMSGLDKCDEGQILFEGKDIKNINKDKYRSSMISTIYQDFALFPTLTVLENIMYQMNLNKMDKAKAKATALELMNKVSLSENLKDSYPSEISGGEQQRVAVARGLSMQRSLILADEPTGNLDNVNSEVIIDILKRLAHEDNCCIIVVTHDISIMKSADEVYTLYNGKLVKQD